MIIVNEHGQIIGDNGIAWLRDHKGLYSIDPRGYFIELQNDGITWCLFRKTKSSYEKVSYVRQVLGTGSIVHCMSVAEIYEIKRV